VTILHAILLGIIQGLTEFIPVSSTAHILIAEHLLKIPADQATFTFTVMVQLGTILSLIIFFWQDLLAIVMTTLKNLGGIRNFNALPENARMGWFIVIATIPALLAGALLKKYVEALFGQPLLEASIRLFAAAILLTLAESFGKRTRDITKMNWLDALVIGLMQVISVFPGASRSGTTISAGMLRNLDRPAAARFAFLMAVPVMLAAGIYQSLDLFSMANFQQFLPMVITGIITSCIVGWAAIKWLMTYLNKNTLYLFAGYCALAGALCVFLQISGL
jgi:undecaprenyl-diphosphatase